MAKFAYRVRNSAGKNVAGELVATDVNEASRLLRKEGHTIVNLSEHSGAVVAPVAHGPIRKVRREDIIYFATQLAVMVDTGVPISEALDAIADQTDHTGMKKLVGDISEQVKGGVEFSRALESHPKEFSKLFTALMRASEASGTMGMMLTRVSDYMVQERDTIKRIKGAMIYPMCMLSFCVVVVVALLVFVLPKFEKIYTSKGAALPKPTAILLAMSSGIRDYWPFLLTVLAVGITGGILFARSEQGRMFLDGVRIRLPLLGEMYRKAYIARSLRTMATMVSTGVSVLEGMAITAEVAGNYYFAKIWKDMSEKVKEGSSMSEELYNCTLIPRTVTQMISAGERTGKMGLVMNRVADFCEDDLKVSIKTLTSMIEPIMIIFMGLLVGGIAISLLLPIFSISKVVAH